MKDIDFDELDKAVNSLMLSPQLDSAEPQTPITPSVEQPPVQAAPAPSPAPVQSEPTPAVTPAVRRGGRFMDMVSTPNAQRPTASTPVPSSAPAPSREGLSITSRSESISFEQPDSSEPVTMSTPAAPVAEATIPDPIDIPAPAIEVPQPAVSPESNPEPVVQQLGSLESPFIADAKVEKRPLNAGTSEAPLVDLAAALEEDAHEEASTGLQDVPAESESEAVENGEDEPPITPQVAELSSDLVAIEAADNQEVSEAVVAPDTTSEAEEPTKPLGTTSIPQQYTAQPSSGDQSHAAIYDASQYPEPVTHVAKNKSGWLWVLWVILLLGVGAGGAIVLYNLGII